MADNHNFLNPDTAAPGTTLRVLRAVERSDGALVQTAILYAADGETALIGRAAAADSLPVVLSTEDAAALAAAATPGDPATQTTLAAVLSAIGELAKLTDTQPVSAASLPLPENAAQQDTLASVLTAVQALTKPTDAQAVTGALTDEQLRASAIGVSLAETPLPVNAAQQDTLASVLAALQARQPRTLLTAPIDRNTSGDGTAIVAGTPGSVIRVVAVTLLASGDVAAILKSGSTALTGPIDLALAGNGFVLPHASPGEAWMVTADGEDLFINLSDAVAVGGWLVYEVVSA